MADAPEKRQEPPGDAKQAAASAPTKADAPEPDVDEDDLSDLDDVLDDFANTKLDAKSGAPSSKAADAPPSSSPGKPSPAELLVEDEDAFSKELQKEMEQLVGQGDFQKQFDEIMKEMQGELGAAEPSKMKEGGTESSATEGGGASGSKPTEASFQESIRKTMERMQESGDQASAAAASADSDDVLAKMLKEMESGGFGGEGSDEDFSKILMGMMEQLTNKEILYEPMKELNDKFPKWMEENKDKVSKEDLKRYEEQQALVKEITARFNRDGYSDNNAQDREYIVERMQKMQAAGSPPPDLVGDMNAAQEALSDIDQGCPTQ